MNALRWFYGTSFHSHAEESNVEKISSQMRCSGAPSCLHCAALVVEREDELAANAPATRFQWDVSGNGDMYSPGIWCENCQRKVDAKLATDPRTGKHYAACECGANLGVSE